jgi:hypothetical protein
MASDSPEILRLDIGRGLCALFAFFRGRPLDAFELHAIWSYRQEWLSNERGARALVAKDPRIVTGIALAHLFAWVRGTPLNGTERYELNQAENQYVREKKRARR